MKLYDRLFKSPIVFPVEQRTIGSRAKRTAACCVTRYQIEKARVTNVWEGEGGKPASVRDDAKGFGVFVDSRFTS